MLDSQLVLVADAIDAFVNHNAGLIMCTDTELRSHHRCVESAICIKMKMPVSTGQGAASVEHLEWKAFGLVERFKENYCRTTKLS